MKRSGRIRPVSKKRAAQNLAREECRQTVLARDRQCRGAGITPVLCGRTATEVHELGRGPYRRDCFLEPDLCLGLCRWCHQWVTEHPLDAQELELALPGWRIEQLLKEARQ